MHRSSRCVETSHLVITLKKVRLLLHGSFSQSQSPMVGMVFQKRSFGSRSISMMTKRKRSGIRRLVSRASVFNVEIWPITSGRWAFPVHVVHVQRSTSIVALHMVEMVDQLPMRIVILKFGTSSLCRASAGRAAEKMATQSSVNFLQRVSIPGSG